MALDFSTGSYRLYKAQTASVLAWLTETGAKYGVRPPKRMSTASSGTTAAGSAYLIDVNDIVPYAKLVVEAFAYPPPAKVLKDLSQTITSRRRFTDWYQSQSVTDPALERSNKSHRHFNIVLKELLDTLTPSSLEGEATVFHGLARDLKSGLDTTPATTNPFEILELESTAFIDLENVLDSLLQTVSVAKTNPSKTQTGTSYELHDPINDLLFAVFKMLADVHRVRRHIHECLDRYRRRNLSLVSVSAVVNCAIGVVRAIEREFMDAAPHFASWEQVMDTIVTPAQFEGIFRGSLNFSETAYLRSLYCLPFQELRHFRDAFVGSQIAEHLSEYVPILRLESSQIDSQDHWRAEKVILHELFVEIISLGFDISLPTMDELTRKITKVLSDEPIGLSVVFGLQIFLDTQKLLGNAWTPVFNICTLLSLESGEETTRPFREFKASSDTLKSTTEEVIKHLGVMMRIHFDEATKDKVRRDSVQLNAWTTDDFFKKFRGLRPILGPGRPFFFLSHNPVMCGLMHCVALMRSQIGGIDLMNRTMYAVCAAHLYNAARNEGNLQSRWSDMEKLIELYGPSDIFVGAPPKTISAYANHYLIVLGGSATSFAKDKGGMIEASKKGARLFKVPKFIETLEKVLWHKDAEKTETTVDLMEKFLYQTVLRRGTQEQGSSYYLDPVQLLVLLESCMEEEEAKMVFHYYNLHFSCWMLLFQVYSELRQDFTAWLASERRDLNANNVLHFLPGFIFSELAEEEYRKGPGKESILSRVGRVMDDYISKNAHDPSSTTLGVVNDDDLMTETEHGTQQGECIHWGVCDRIDIGQGWQPAVEFGPKLGKAQKRHKAP